MKVDGFETLALSFFTGLRTGEAVGLKWEDISFKNQYELIHDRSDYVFLSHLGKPLNDGNRIRDYYSKKLLQKLDLPYQRLYDTRSSFATMMLSSEKFSINHIAQIMGHTNIEMLIHRYNKFIPSEIRKINKSIGLF